MLRALSGQEPPASLVQAVYSETEGNPFFVEEVFQHLAEEGKLFDAQGRWRSDLSIGELEVPRGVRLVIGRRLERVCEECRGVLTTAAVIGRGFSFELLEALGEVETDALLDAVDEAERAHLIASTADGPEARFTFAHELIRQTLVSGLSLPRRQRHAPAGGRGDGAGLRPHPGGARRRPGPPPVPGGDSRRAARRRLTTWRWPASERWRQRHSRTPCATTRAPSPCSRPMTGRGGPTCCYKRGLALRSLGRWEEALADWREALDTYEELGDAEAVGRICHGHCYQLGWGARSRSP